MTRHTLIIYLVAVKYKYWTFNWVEFIICDSSGKVIVKVGDEHHMSGPQVLNLFVVFVRPQVVVEYCLTPIVNVCGQFEDHFSVDLSRERYDAHQYQPVHVIRIERGQHKRHPSALWPAKDWKFAIT